MSTRRDEARPDHADSQIHPLTHTDLCRMSEEILSSSPPASLASKNSNNEAAAVATSQPSAYELKVDEERGADEPEKEKDGGVKTSDNDDDVNRFENGGDGSVLPPTSPPLPLPLVVPTHSLLSRTKSDNYRSGSTVASCGKRQDRVDAKSDPAMLLLGRSNSANELSNLIKTGNSCSPAGNNNTSNSNNSNNGGSDNKLTLIKYLFGLCCSDYLQSDASQTIPIASAFSAASSVRDVRQQQQQAAQFSLYKKATNERNRKNDDDNYDQNKSSDDINYGKKERNSEDNDDPTNHQHQQHHQREETTNLNDDALLRGHKLVDGIGTVSKSLLNFNEAIVETSIAEYTPSSKLPSWSVNIRRTNEQIEQIEFQKRMNAVTADRRPSSDAGVGGGGDEDDDINVNELIPRFLENMRRQQAEIDNCVYADDTNDHSDGEERGHYGRRAKGSTHSEAILETTSGAMSLPSTPFQAKKKTGSILYKSFKLSGKKKGKNYHSKLLNDLSKPPRVEINAYNSDDSDDYDVSASFSGGNALTRHSLVTKLNDSLKKNLIRSRDSSKSKTARKSSKNVTFKLFEESSKSASAQSKSNG